MNWTASGVHLYSFVKYGSSAGSQEHAVPRLERLGVRAYMLQSMPYLTLQVCAWEEEHYICFRGGGVNPKLC